MTRIIRKSVVQVFEEDRVKTKSGLHGIVLSVTHSDVAHVSWDDGREFPMRTCHLEVLAHNYDPVTRKPRYNGVDSGNNQLAPR